MSESIDKTADGGWTLTDCAYPNPLDDRGLGTVGVTSSQQLRSLLNELSQQKPRIVELAKDGGPRLQIAIGGPIGAVECYEMDPIKLPLIAVTSHVVATEVKWFSFGGQPADVAPRNLLPESKVAEICDYIYRTESLPADVAWERWKPTGY